MGSQLASLSATDAIAHFAAGTLSPVELMRAVIERAEKLEPLINAFVVSADHSQCGKFAQFGHFAVR